MTARLLLALLLPATLSAQAATEPAAGATPSRPLPLAEAVRLAQRNAPAAVQARGRTRSSAASARAAYASFLPNVTLSAGSIRQFGGGQTRVNQNGEQITVPSRPWSYTDAFTLNAELFDGGRRLFDLSAARASTESAEANEVTQRFRLALEVKQQFFAVLAAQEAERAAAAQLEQANQQLRAASARVRAGAATRSDSLRSVIQVGNARLALLTARNNLRGAEAALTRLVGSTEPVTAEPSDTVDLAPVPLDSTTLLALAERGPTVQEAQAGSAAARAARRAARTPYLPTISVSYSRGGSGFDARYGFGTDPFTYTGSLRFNLSYPLFNQWRREESIVRADVAEDNASAAERDARLAVRQQAIQLLGALGTAEQRITIQTASVAAAEEDLRVQQQRYALGASTLLDLLTSQTQLNQARSALIQARYDYRVARAQVEALIGRELSATGSLR